MTLRLMSYNIRFGGEGREALIAMVIERCDPDLVLLQEATKPEVVKKLADALEMQRWAASPGHSAAFLSRVDVDHYEWHYHPRLQRPFIELHLAGGKLRIFGVHLRATHSNLTERRRVREVRALLQAIEPYREGFHLLVGDFNTLAPGEILDMQRLPWRYRLLAFALGGRATYKTIQIMLDSGYIDCYRHLQMEPGFTFPSWDPHARIDFVFAPREFADRVKSCDVVTGIPELKQATDHLPLVAEFGIE
jgi:endonuclease/exonuclease/phosphatase family metal-dependent hydrolase